MSTYVILTGRTAGVRKEYFKGKDDKDVCKLTGTAYTNTGKKDENGKYIEQRMRFSMTGNYAEKMSEYLMVPRESVKEGGDKYYSRLVTLRGNLSSITSPTPTEIRLANPDGGEDLVLEVNVDKTFYCVFVESMELHDANPGKKDGNTTNNNTATVKGASGIDIASLIKANQGLVKQSTPQATE